MSRYHEVKRDFVRSCGPIDDFRAPCVLDYLTVAPYCAFGLRRLRANYDGPFVRLRRASDGKQKDFGAAGWSGEIDKAGIAAFKGASTLTAVRFYDQGEMGLDFLQNSATRQPAYTESGLLSKPALYFDGVNDYFDFCEAPLNILSGQAYTTMYLGKKDSSSDYLICFAGAGTTYGTLMAASSSTGNAAIYESGLGALVGWAYGTHPTAATIMGSKRNAANQVTHYYNGDSNLRGTLAVTLSVSYMGQRATIAKTTKGHISEAYLFLSELSDADRIALRDNINEHFGVY